LQDGTLGVGCLLRLGRSERVELESALGGDPGAQPLAWLTGLPEHAAAKLNWLGDSCIDKA